MLKRTTSYSFYSIGLFILWPLLALFNAFLNFKRPFSKNILWFFVAYYGFTFVLANEGLDANRYISWFEQNKGSSLSLREFVSSFYTEESKIVDVVEPTLSFLISSFTNDYKVLFLAYGFIFGYFYSRNIWFLLEGVLKKLSIQSLILLGCFLLLNPFWNINGFRFNTATHVFLFGILPFLFYGTKRSLWAIFVAPLFHFSFVIPLIVFFIYILIGTRMKFYFWFMIVSFFISEINLVWIQTNLNILPDVFENRTNIYISKGLSDFNLISTNWYAMIYMDVIKYATIVIATLIYLKEAARINNNQGMSSLFGFSCLFFAFTNVIAVVPSGPRFYMLAELCFFAFFFVYHQFQNQQSFLKKIVIWSSPFLLFYCIVIGRIGLDSIGFVTTFCNPLVAGLITKDMGLIELFK